MLAYLDDAWPGPLVAQDQSPGDKAGAWAAALGQKGRTTQRALRLEGLRAAGLDQIGDVNPAVWVQDGHQPFFLLTLFRGPAGHSKHTGHLRKYTDGVNRIDVRDEV